MWPLVETCLWIGSIILPLMLLVAGRRNGIHRLAPVFFAFLGFLVTRDACLFLIHRAWPHAYKVYFNVYWSTSFLSIALRVIVVREIFDSVMADYPRHRNLARRLFLVVAGALLAFAVLSGSVHPAHGLDRMLASIVAFRRGILILEAGLLVSLLALSTFFGLSWRKVPFGIALGLAAYGLLQTASLTLVAKIGRDSSMLYALCDSGTYLCANLVWLTYCTRLPERLLPSTDDVAENAEVLRTEVLNNNKAYLDLLTS